MSGFESEPAAVRRDGEVDDALAGFHGPNWAQTRRGVWVIGRDQREAGRAGARFKALAQNISPELVDVTATGPAPNPDLIRKLAGLSVLAVIYMPEADHVGVRSALNATSLLERTGAPGRSLPSLVATPAPSVVGPPRIKLTTGDGGRQPSIGAIVEGFDAGSGEPNLDWDLQSVERLRSGVIAALGSKGLMVRSGTGQTPPLPAKEAGGTSGGNPPRWAIFSRKTGSGR